MGSTIVTDLLARIDGTLLAGALNGAAAFAGSTRPVFNSLVTIYVLLWGLAMWRGLIEEPMSDGVVRVVKVVLIGTFALNMAVYGPYIANALFRSPEQLVQAVMPAATTASTSMALDRALDTGLSVGKRFTDNIGALSPFQSLAWIIQALIIWLFTIILVGYATALVLLSKIVLAVMLAIGPLFIALLMFDATRQFFAGWLGQALNGVFHYVIAILFAGLGINFFDFAAREALMLTTGGIPTFIHVAQMLLVGIAVFATLMQAGPVASALAGGVQIGTMSLVGWSMRAAGRGVTAPGRGVIGLRNWNERRIARDYHRSALGLPPTLATRGLRMITQSVRGSNSVERR